MSLNVNRSAPRMGIMMPTKQQLITTYSSILKGAIKAKTIVALKHAPAGASKTTGLDINKPGTRGVSREIYTLHGELYLRTEVVSENPKPKWFKVGPQPLF